MSYNYLTINGITKICDDNIYIDENGKFTQIQWYDFQLDFALKNLNTDLTEYLYHPLTNYKLTRSEILELIFKITGTNIINTSDSVKKEDLIKHGLFKGDGIKNCFLLARAFSRIKYLEPL